MNRGGNDFKLRGFHGGSITKWIDAMFSLKYYTLSRTVLHHLLRRFVLFCSSIFELTFTLNLTKSATRCKEGIENLVEKKPYIITFSNYQPFVH